jgi:hypothetical protein
MPRIRTKIGLPGVCDVRQADLSRALPEAYNYRAFLGYVQGNPAREANVLVVVSYLDASEKKQLARRTGLS